MDVALVTRKADGMMKHLQDADAFQPARLIRSRRAVNAGDIGAELIQRAGYRPEAAFTATDAASLGGELRKGDVLT